MKANIKFYVSKKFFYHPRDLKVYSFFTKGEDLDDCINNAGNRLEKLIGSIDYITVQEISGKVVK